MNVLPLGAVELTADELLDILANGDHPETRALPATDEIIVAAVRLGLLVAVRLDDGRIAFTRTTS